jgi:hypothetical protein
MKRGNKKNVKGTNQIPEPGAQHREKVTQPENCRKASRHNSGSPCSSKKLFISQGTMEGTSTKKRKGISGARVIQNSSRFMSRKTYTSRDAGNPGINGRNISRKDEEWLSSRRSLRVETSNERQAGWAHICWGRPGRSPTPWVQQYATQNALQTWNFSIQYIRALQNFERYLAFIHQSSEMKSYQIALHQMS